MFVKNKEEWTLDGAKEHVFTFTVKTPQTNNITEAGKLSVRGNFADGIKREWSQSLRVTAGTTAYREAEFVCLENEHLIARFVMATGILHNLIVRRTGMELLSPDKYPMGLTWYTRRTGGTIKNMEAGQITLSSGAVSMTATLKPGQEFLDVSYDAKGIKLTNKDTFYLMARIAKDGIFKDNVMHVPLKDKVRELKWNSGNKEYKPEEIARPWLAVEDKASRHILATFFDVPNLEKISLAPGQNSFNYEIFYLKEGASAGKIHFRLFGGQGGVEKIPAWETEWKTRGQ